MADLQRGGDGDQVVARGLAEGVGGLQEGHAEQALAGAGDVHGGGVVHGGVADAGRGLPQVRVGEVSQDGFQVKLPLDEVGFGGRRAASSKKKVRWW